MTTGVEPDIENATSDCLACSCVIGDKCHAARALQTANAICHPLAFSDADLQHVVIRMPAGLLLLASQDLAEELPPALVFWRGLHGSSCTLFASWENTIDTAIHRRHQRQRQSPNERGTGNWIQKSARRSRPHRDK